MKLESNASNRCTEEVKTKIHVDTVQANKKVTKLNSIKQKSGEKTAHKFCSELGESY